ncbi:methyl-accepting chemotaxis protein [Dechloromonas denitrificans]|uniref:methyl-accepting chemotaxis protein n=1 Tax=Dechloromonas denitrificans TaxID=281362 RepID=UPI001CF99C50|nr:PAS domain-containing methyl-accepting chemotaxis protein [Dechloromonas denitrificans]UCV09911.1 methyl-accepting chemotaxis protein [Dechloromonas denitrificans]
MKTNLPVTSNEVAFPKGRYIVSRTDLKGIITYVNDTFVDISGFSRTELIGNNHNVVRHPDMLPAAFAWLWETIKDGRPWRGIVKNRCKNGDYYWVDALVVPVLKDNRTIGYMSVRTEPTRQQVSAAEALYGKLKSGTAKIPRPGLWQRLSLRAKMSGFVLWLIAVQLLGAATHMAGPALGLAPATIEGAMLFLLASGVLAGLGLHLVQRGMMRSIAQVIAHQEHIAQGDLTDGIPMYRVDELGRLNDSLVTMQTHMKVMMAQIAEAADEVGVDADILQAEMDQSRQAAEAQSQAVNHIAATVEELVASVDEIALSAGQAATTVNASDLLLADAVIRMDESQQASQSVVATVNSAEQTMSELFRSISAIDRVSQLIRGIAEQTNLLALNAAIEAARAGESGRGFAVVADEVRKLAENASKQTAEITNSVQDIQRVTQIAVATMATAGSKVDSADSAASAARAGLDAVSRQGEEVASISRHIADGTRQQSAAGNQIALQVEDIVAGIEQASTAIQAVNEKTLQMKETSLRLQQLIAHFRIIG